MPVSTCANGDCGIDSLLLVEGACRGVQVCHALRLQIASHIHEIAGDKRWQDTFTNLEVWPEQEEPPPPLHPPEGPAPPPPLPPPEGPPPPLPQPDTKPSAKPAPADVGAQSSCSVLAAQDVLNRDEFWDCIIWSTGQRDPDAGLVQHLRTTLTSEELLALSKAYNEQASTIVESRIAAKSFVQRVAGLSHRRTTLPQRAKDAGVFRKWAEAAGLDLSKRLPYGAWKRFGQHHSTRKLTPTELGRCRAYFRRCLAVPHGRVRECQFKDDEHPRMWSSAPEGESLSHKREMDRTDMGEIRLPNQHRCASSGIHVPRRRCSAEEVAGTST